MTDTTEKKKIPPYCIIKGVKWTPDLIKEKIEKSDKAVMAALLRVYGWQTEDEKRIGETREHNGRGFNGTDAEILSSFAKQLISRQFLSPKQIALTRKKIKKYAKQIYVHHLVATKQAVQMKFGL